MAKYALDTSDTLLESIAHTTPALDAINASNKLLESIAHDTTPVLDAINASENFFKSIAHDTTPVLDAINASNRLLESIAHDTTPVLDTINASENFFKSIAHDTTPVLDAINASNRLLESIAHDTTPVLDTINASENFFKSIAHDTIPALDAITASNRLLESIAHDTPTFEEAKEHRVAYVETDYNHDLAHRSTEEPTHAIEDYNRVITPAVPNQHQITEALTSLREDAKASQDISSQRHTEVLERLELLSDQVKLVNPKRRAGLIKIALLGLGAVLSKLSDLTELWSQWNDEIKNFLRMLAEFCSRCGDLIKNFLGPYE